VVVFFIALCAVASLPVLELGRIDAAALLYANPLVRIFEFYIGMLSYPLLVALRPMVLRMSPWLATVAEAVVIAFFLCLIYRPLHTVLFSGTGNFAKMAAVYAGKSGGSAPAAALLIVVFAAQRGAVSKFLQLPICIFLGEISYAFYLVHAIVLAWYAPQESGDYFSWDAPAAYVHYWTTCLSVSSALYLCVERPCRAAIRHLPDMRLADLRTVLSIRFLRRQAASTYACACYAALLVVGVDFWLGHLYLSPVKH
jgi:peptidoglycan/LPS O-acetylase OafA/YrhL